MRYSFNGKNTVVSESLKERAIQKIGRLERLFPAETEVSVTFSVVKLENKIEITIPLQKRVLRSEVVGDDMYAALDEIVDKLERQMVKYKKRLISKSRRDTAYRAEYDLYFPVSAEEAVDYADGEVFIQKSKRFALKPMDAEEAVMEMEMLGHNFFVFRSSVTEDVNVVYKRNDGTYGLIEPGY